MVLTLNSERESHCRYTPWIGPGGNVICTLLGRMSWIEEGEWEGRDG